METRLLEYFVTVADERSVTAASARLFAAQSTVSAGLQSLERDLGVRLLERTTKAVQLTPAGETLLPLARAVLDDVAAVRQVAGESGTGLRGRIRIGTFAGLRIIDLPGFLGDFRRSHPLVDIRLSVSPTGSVGLLDDLQRDRLDLALTAVTPPAGMSAWELGAYPYVALLPPGHARAADRALALADLAGDDWVDVLPGYGNRVQLETELAYLVIPRYRRRSVDAKRLEAARAFIRKSAGNMKALLLDPVENLARLEDFPMIEKPRVCRRCNFRRLCFPRAEEARLAYAAAASTMAARS